MEKPATIEQRRDLSEYFAYWKSITRDNQKVPAHIFLLHDLILGRDPKKCSFSPITNKNKLDNGQNRWDSLMIAKFYVQFRAIKNPQLLEKTLLELSGTDVSALGIKVEEIKSKP